MSNTANAIGVTGGHDNPWRADFPILEQTAHGKPMLGGNISHYDFFNNPRARLNAYRQASGGA